jgi:hypothetical protein
MITKIVSADKAELLNIELLIHVFFNEVQKYMHALCNKISPQLQKNILTTGLPHKQINKKKAKNNATQIKIPIKHLIFFFVIQKNCALQKKEYIDIFKITINYRRLISLYV